jgi:hypothetical protein
MRASLLRDRNQVTLPGEVVEAAGLVPQHDYIAWRFESGEIRGRKQSPAPDRTGRVARDRKTGLLFWDGDISAEEAENAALSANFNRERANTLTLPSLCSPARMPAPWDSPPGSLLPEHASP